MSESWTLACQQPQIPQLYTKYEHIWDHYVRIHIFVFGSWCKQARYYLFRLLFCRDLPDNLKLVWDSILFLTSCWITCLVFASSVGVIFSLLAAIVSVEAAQLGFTTSSFSVGSGAPSSLAPCSKPWNPLSSQWSKLQSRVSYMHV